MTKTSVKKAAKTRTTPYDVAECLRTPEEMAAYLDAWLEDAPEDAAGIARALGDIARAKGRIAELESRNGTLIPAKEVFGKFEWNASFDCKAERSRKEPHLLFRIHLYSQVHQCRELHGATR